MLNVYEHEIDPLNLGNSIVIKYSNDVFKIRLNINFQDDDLDTGKDEVFDFTIENNSTSIVCDQIESKIMDLRL